VKGWMIVKFGLKVFSLENKWWRSDGVNSGLEWEVGELNI
jgi:hypothetical protein